MKRMKRGSAVFLVFMLCLGLAACGKEFDAAGYVKSALDANYHEEYKAYAEFTDSSEEEIKEEIEENNKKTIEKELKEVELELPEEMKAEISEAYEKIYQLAKYEVKEAEKQDDQSYLVAVEVSPFNMNQALYNSSKEIAGEMVKKGENPAEDEEAFGRLLIESVERVAAEPSYEEPVTVHVKVAPDDKNVYSIESGEWEKLGQALFPENLDNLS